MYLARDGLILSLLSLFLCDPMPEICPNLRLFFKKRKREFLAACRIKDREAVGMTRSDVFILGLLLGGLVLFFLFRFWRSYTAKKHLKRARKGEAQAIKFLEDRGYTITGIQERKTIITWINGSPRRNQLTADLIAKKRGRTYLAEVKTGKKASRPLLASTRRQLLEYFLAFRPYGILLVDMEKKALHEIAFEVCENGEGWRYPAAAVVMAVLGLICGWFLYKYTGGGI